MRYISCCLIVVLFAVPSPLKADDASFLLTPKLAAGDTSAVKVRLELGGDMIVTEESGQEKKLPLTVAGEARYYEQLMTWSADSSEAVRARREYQSATAKIQVDEGGINRELPAEKSAVLVEIQDGRAKFDGTDSPLTREQYDLVNTVGNSLALNHLLPARELAEGDNWDHSSDAIGALLGMDHIAVCEVSSVVTGCVERQVQIRLAGTVHGTIDGAPTEMQLRGAYLFHEEHQRITKFNLAIKEQRTASQIVPGLDIVAKVFVTVVPTKKDLPASFESLSKQDARPLADALRFEAPQRGYQFLHDRVWYVTAEQSDFVSLRALHDGNLTAHCNLTTLPARSEGRETTLEEFERDVRQSLGDNLETVTASTKWTTQKGHECLGVVAQGKVKDVPIEWRYYLVASPGLPRVSLGVTVEQSQVEKFDDADRQIVESLELVAKQSTTAKRVGNATR